MLDEGLQVVNGLWSGKPFSFVGDHYTVKDAHFITATLQQPRIPIWVGGKWPNRAPFRRAAQWDGVFPIFSRTAPVSYPTQIREMMRFLLDHRESNDSFDVTVQGTTPGNDLIYAAEVVAEYAEAGVTWWQEAINERRPDLIERAGKASWLDAVRWRIQQGPPRM